jgi:hypothetical protein
MPPRLDYWTLAYICVQYLRPTASYPHDSVAELGGGGGAWGAVIFQEFSGANFMDDLLSAF